MGTATSKSVDSCVMCLCLSDSDGSRHDYDDDAEADDRWQNLRQKRRASLQQQQSVDALLRRGTAAAATANNSAQQQPQPQDRDQQLNHELQRVPVRSHNTLELGRRLSEGVRRIGSLQEEIDWIERERKVGVSLVLQHQ